MYCVKCKQKTKSINIAEVISKNNRRMLQAICFICGSKKSSFIQNNKKGQGIGDVVNKAIGKLGDYGVELHLPTSRGEYIPGGSFNNQQNYSYCGPGTKYEQRNKEGYQGINELDSMCKLHDQFYNENLDTRSRNVSDIALAHRAKEIANDPRYDDEQRRFAKYIEIIMNGKARIGLGIKSKNSKKGLMKGK